MRESEIKCINETENKPEKKEKVLRFIKFVGIRGEFRDAGNQPCAYDHVRRLSRDSALYLAWNNGYENNGIIYIGELVDPE